MIELLFADCNSQSLTKKFPLRNQKFLHSSQISSQISVGFANFVDMGAYLIIVFKLTVSMTEFHLDLTIFPFPQSWQTQQISRRKFGKNEEIFVIWEEISWLATDNCSPQRAVQSLGIERKFFLSKWLKIRAIFNFNLSYVLNPKYYRVSNQLLSTFCIDILLV